MNSEAPVDAAPDADACQAQLGRIIESAGFRATDRDRRFLTYVVEESLAGRAARIKAYTIAVEVFGRDATFDPQTDPIVRVEAGHLRRALDHYYLSAGADDPVLITVPKGGYAPCFAARGLPPSAATPHAPSPDDPPVVAVRRRPARRRVEIGIAALLLATLAGGVLMRRAPAGPPMPDVPTLAVTTPRLLGGDPADAALADGLAAELVAELARFRDIVVVAPMEAGDRARAPRYTLEGNLARNDDELKAQLTLHRSGDGTVIWARSYVADLVTERPLAAETRIAREAATAVGQPYGAIFQADSEARAGRPPDPDDGYACVLAYFEFRAVIDTAGYHKARDCVDRAVKRFPDYATGWALRAQITIDGRRWAFDPDADLAQALADARHALMLDPTNVRATQAKMMALYGGGDIEGALRVGAAGVALNPNDTDILGEYGYRLALSGDWTQGCALLSTAVERNPGPLPYYETGLALCAYIAGDYAAAAARIRAAAFPDVPIYHLMAVAFYAEAGQIDDAHRERDWLNAHAPALIDNVAARIRPMVSRDEDYARFVQSLEHAGVSVR